MRQHDRLIAALCEDIMDTGKFSLDGPKVSRVAEINRQINSTREPEAANNRPGLNNGD